MMDRNFEMPTTKEPPRDPATPRPIDEARKERENRAEAQREQDTRATALGLAMHTLRPDADPVTLDEILVLANHFVAYITDGTTP